MYPSLLLHPNIPKPLHTMAPRVFLGEQWWKETKAIAKAKFHNHCWACGVHKFDASYHPWLEAHECYSMNYTTGRVEYVGTVALCHSCHGYIHCGRMVARCRKGEYPQEKYLDILSHGNSVLRAFVESRGGHWGMEKRPFKPQQKMVNYYSEFQPPNYRWWGGGAVWEDYHMVIYGEIYPARFKSLQEWKNHWGD